ncbi:RHS repeat-associated core domain-containing protein [Pseudomonas vancouverensis]|uniref:RHS repeat-associated core domain-containing protein n=1 Tax=Pseudomonas vancouverensis TaxID=95300 RepID=A0A1H2P2M4_PSEVA|nr:RHS repeat-associated core domain-containing protein [Pseudomonas vancouverensis]KAB0499591.1 RHS repeat-associated core domain-containing protein [Pseudomonas vancouverensis]TDB56580.1 RHS repeat-associated core domain-containing protein [Pseudomonas vancouverensis]SDV11585.1 RHS repeat-associated core domain-containing protein [Pseudomonas vancouverensis]
MTAQPATLLCRYHCDPLDRVAGYAPLSQPILQRFYRKERLATEIQGQVWFSLFEHEAQPLAQQQWQAGKVESLLSATDLQRSILHLISATERQQQTYCAYGNRSPEGGLISLLGFNGERRDPVTGHYLLGNGYRGFNPVLMRFNCPDSLSPFGKGGVNAYAYCQGDPVNKVDPRGEFATFIRGVTQLVSTPISAVRQVGKGVRAMKNSVLSNVPLSTRPAGKGYGTSTTINSNSRAAGNNSRMSPMNALIDEADDQVKLRRIGKEFTAAKAARDSTPLPPIARFAKSKGYSETDLFAQAGYQNSPEVQQQYKLSKYAQERLTQADIDFLTAEGIHVKKYPRSEQATRKWVAKIRSS